MQKSKLQTILRVIGFLLLPIAGLLFLLFLLGGEIGLSLMFGLSVLMAIYLISGAPHLLRAVDRFPKIKSEYEGDSAFIQTGGLQFRSGWRVTNLTMPFANMRVTREAILVTGSFIGWTRCSFSFPRSSIRGLRWRRIFFNLGVQIEHDLPSYPAYILFWVSDRKALIQGLRDFGYEVSDG